MFAALQVWNTPVNVAYLTYKTSMCCDREIKSERECENVCVCACVCERRRLSACVCMRERERVCVCVCMCMRERECVCVSVCVWERESVCVSLSLFTNLQHHSSWLDDQLAPIFALLFFFHIDKCFLFHSITLSNYLSSCLSSYSFLQYTSLCMSFILYLLLSFSLFYISLSSFSYSLSSLSLSLSFLFFVIVCLSLSTFHLCSLAFFEIAFRSLF